MLGTFSVFFGYFFKYSLFFMSSFSFWNFHSTCICTWMVFPRDLGLFFFFFNHRFFFLLVKLDISRDFPLRFVDACLLNSLSSEFSSFVYCAFQPKNLQWIAFYNFRLWRFCIWWDTASHPLAQWSPNESSTIYVSVLTTETSRLCRRAVVLGHAFSTQQGTLQPLLPAGTCGPGGGESAGPSQD